MKTIYVAKDKDGAIYEYTSEPELRRGQYYPTGSGCAVKANTLDIELAPLEVVKIHIDTDKGTFVIERTRKDGYYAATADGGSITWILQSIGGTLHYYSGGEFRHLHSLTIGKNPIPKECLPC